MTVSLCQLSGWLPHCANCQDDCLIMPIVRMIASLWQLSGWLSHYANCQDDCLIMPIVRMIASLRQLSGWLSHYANCQDDCLITPTVRMIVSLCQLSGWLPHYANCQDDCLIMPIVRMHRTCRRTLYGLTISNILLQFRQYNMTELHKPQQLAYWQTRHSPSHFCRCRGVVGGSTVCNRSNCHVLQSTHPEVNSDNGTAHVNSATISYRKVYKLRHASYGNILNTNTTYHNLHKPTIVHTYKKQLADNIY